MTEKEILSRLNELGICCDFNYVNADNFLNRIKWHFIQKCISECYSKVEQEARRTKSDIAMHL